MPNERLIYVDGFVVYQNYYFFNEITHEMDLSRNVIYETAHQSEAEVKQYCDTWNAAHPNEEAYYYESARVLD